MGSDSARVAAIHETPLSIPNIIHFARSSICHQSATVQRIRHHAFAVRSISSRPPYLGQAPREPSSVTIRARDAGGTHIVLAVALAPSQRVGVAKTSRL